MSPSGSSFSEMYMAIVRILVGDFRQNWERVGT